MCGYIILFLWREIIKAHLSDYPPVVRISSRLPCCTVYIHEMTVMYCVYPQDDHAALCLSTRWPCCPVSIHEMTMLHCVYPRDDHAALWVSPKWPCCTVCVCPADTTLHCVFTRLSWCTMCLHEITMLHCVYPRDYHAASCVSRNLPCCTVYIHEITVLNRVYPASQLWNSRLVSWMVLILCQQRPANCRTLWFPIIHQ
jgi:hypothetical protein